MNYFVNRNVGFSNLQYESERKYSIGLIQKHIFLFAIRYYQFLFYQLALFCQIGGVVETLGFLYP